MQKKFILTLILLCLFVKLAYSETLMVDYLCELGTTFYRLGEYDDALLEFEKVLIREPYNQTAKNYINNIFQQEIAPALGKEKAVFKMDENKQKIAGIKISGQSQFSLGLTPEDIIWKQANADLNERNWRMLSEAAYNRRQSTYDTRIYDRLRINLDTDNQEGLGFHSNITIDPWSFTGKSDKVTIGSGGGASDYAEIQLKYWSNTRYTINETVYTLEDGASIALPEIKVVEAKTQATPVTNTWGATLTIPELKIKTEFQPLRELWFDYKQEDLNLRLFPLAYQDKALTSDDPLKLSNNHIWWEESPWLDRWLPGRLNSGASPIDFTKGKWDDALSFFTRDSDGVRLVNLRGFSFAFAPSEATAISATVASPKGLWQDYGEVDNIIGAARLKSKLSDNLNMGTTYTMRMGLNVDKDDKTDSRNHVLGVDLGYEIMEGLKSSWEIASSRSDYDLTNSQYKSKSRGNAFYFSLLGRYPPKSIIDLNVYDEIKPDKNESFLAKTRFFIAHMDEGFDPSLSTYRQTRKDTFWSRHLHFRRPLEYYYTGLYYLGLKWEDIAPFRIGNGIDIGRDVVGFRLETTWPDKLDNLFDVRNVHNTNGKFIENVARDEITYEVNDKLTTKLLGIYHKLHKTYGGVDPFVFNNDTGIYLNNSAIADGKDPSLKTGSLGLEYAFTDWLSANGIWEHTNDYTLAYDNFPRGNLSSTSFVTYTEYDKIYRQEDPFLYSQGLFPQPPYPYYDIFRTGLRFRPTKDLEIYLDYTRNEFKSAGQIDENMNHIGFEAAYLPNKKLGIYFRYVYSRLNDLTLMRQGYSKYYLGHHNFFSEFRYLPTPDDEFVLQYGESGRLPIFVTIADPFGSGLLTLDTQHILRIYYRRKF